MYPSVKKFLKVRPIVTSYKRHSKVLMLQVNSKWNFKVLELLIMKAFALKANCSMGCIKPAMLSNI
jgi:hypothetical protein